MITVAVVGSAERAVVLFVMPDAPTGTRFGLPRRGSSLSSAHEKQCSAGPVCSARDRGKMPTAAGLGDDDLGRAPSLCARRPPHPHPLSHCRRHGLLCHCAQFANLGEFELTQTDTPNADVSDIDTSGFEAVSRHLGGR